MSFTATTNFLRATLGTMLIVSIALVPLASGQDEKPKKENAKDGTDPPKATEAAEPVEPAEKVDRYAVPEGGVEELLTFIDGLRKYRPTSREDYIQHVTKAGGALRAAADKIIELKPGEDTEAFKLATLVLLQQRVAGVGHVADDEVTEIIQAVRDRVSKVEADKLANDDIGLMMMLSQQLERGGKTKQAADVFHEFGELLAKSSDEQKAGMGRIMQGSARRMNLIGNEMKIEGTTMDGKPFAWDSYRGKVVLVDFWATWCGPCLSEIPNLRSNYEKYHDQGFEVVGISLDQDREALEKFLATEKLPWTTLNEPGSDRNPNAEYYGIMGIPTVILVNREGKVVSVNARGPELGRLLTELIGPPSTESPEKDN